MSVPEPASAWASSTAGVRRGGVGACRSVRCGGVRAGGVCSTPAARTVSIIRDHDHDHDDDDDDDD
eukprot:3841040-Rhodomonas_salina.1